MAGTNSCYEGKIAGLYDLDRTLGKGHYAVVKLARHVFTGEKVAVKVIDKTKLDKNAMGHLLQEVRCMKLVQHPNVVRLYEVIDTQTKLYLILELGDGGDMFDYIMKYEGGLSEDQAKVYFAQIVHAISYCHKLHVVHRDLKPENVVFFKEQGAVKLTDFGFSNRFQPGKMLATSCGSLAYSAPEILLGDEYEAPAVDIWSLGVILYMLVCGHPPFQEANDSETLTMILDCRYTVPEHISPECTDLISWMLQRDPKKRASLEQIESHPWLQGVDPSPASRSALPLTSYKSVSEEEHEIIIQAMTCGSIADRETIQNALEEDQYNHITATYFLLAERILREKQEKQTLNQNQNLNLVYNWANQVQSRRPLSEALTTFGDAKVHSAFSDVPKGLTDLQLPKIQNLLQGHAVMAAPDAGKTESGNRMTFAFSTIKEAEEPTRAIGKEEPTRVLLRTPAATEAPVPRNGIALQCITEEEEEEEEDDIMEVASRNSSQDLLQRLSPQDMDMQKGGCLNTCDTFDGKSSGLEKVSSKGMYGHTQDSEVETEGEVVRGWDEGQGEGRSSAAEIFCPETQEEGGTVNKNCSDNLSSVCKEQKSTAPSCNSVEEHSERHTSVHDEPKGTVPEYDMMGHSESHIHAREHPKGIATVSDSVKGHNERHISACGKYKRTVLPCESLMGHSDSQVCVCEEPKDLPPVCDGVKGHTRSHLCVCEEQKDSTLACNTVKAHSDNEVCVYKEPKDSGPVCDGMKDRSESHLSVCEKPKNLSIMCDTIKRHSKSHLCEEPKDLAPARNIVKGHSENQVYVFEEPKDSGRVCNSMKGQSDSNISVSETPIGTAPVCSSMKCHSESHVCEDPKNLVLMCDCSKKQSESHASICEEPKDSDPANDSMADHRNSLVSVCEGLKCTAPMHDSMKGHVESRILEEHKNLALVCDSMKGHSGCNVSICEESSGAAPLCESLKGCCESLDCEDPKVSALVRHCMKGNNDCSISISIDPESTALECGSVKRPFEDTGRDITRSTRDPNWPECCNGKLGNGQGCLKIHERQQVLTSEYNNNAASVMGQTLAPSPKGMAEDSSAYSTSSISLCCVTASAKEGESITLKTLGTVEMDSARAPHGLPGAISSESSKQAGDEMNTSCGDSNSACAESSSETVIKMDPAKNKNHNLRDRILQFPLCEKALAFKIKPNSKESLLSFGQFNCCHVI